MLGTGCAVNYLLSISIPVASSSAAAQTSARRICHVDGILIGVIRRIVTSALAVCLFIANTPVAFAVSFPAKATIAVVQGNLRQKPSVRAIVLDKMCYGEPVTVLGQHKSWFYAQRSDGTRGWAHKTLFRKINQSENEIFSKSDLPL
jgi:uncharacterized protein YgiM (DUF1202 family)